MAETSTSLIGGRRRDVDAGADKRREDEVFHAVRAKIQRHHKSRQAHSLAIEGFGDRFGLFLLEAGGELAVLHHTDAAQLFEQFASVAFGHEVFPIEIDHAGKRRQRSDRGKGPRGWAKMWRRVGMKTSLNGGRLVFSLASRRPATGSRRGSRAEG